MSETAIKKRSSNIELLRIFAMLMIITYHICYHCVNVQLTDEASIFTMQNGWFCQPKFYGRLLTVALASPLGQTGNAIFILISGYFLAHKGKNINLTSISKKLLFQLGFAVAVLCIVSTVIYETTEFSFRIINFTEVNTSSWFVGYYFLIILLGKLFLNDFLGRLDRDKYRLFLLVLFLLVQFKWTRELIASLSYGVEKGFAVLCSGIFLYSMGGYIRKYNPFERVKTWAVVATVILIGLIVCSVFYGETANAIKNYDASDGEIFYQTIHEYANYSFVPICLGITLFELFRRIHIKSNKVINYLGASSFMVYLLHDNGFFYRIWDTQDWITLLHSSPALYVLKFTGWMLGVFAFGVAAYTLYLLTEKFVRVIAPAFIKND